MNNDLQLETERLILRLPRRDDFDRYAELFCHPTAAAGIGGGVPRGDAWRRFLQMPGAWMVQGFAMFSVIEKASGLWIGQTGPWQPEGWPGTEVGYAFHQDARGKGYATEATAAAIDWAFDVLGWREVIHCITPDNFGSQAVARRLGSRNRGPGKLPAPLDTREVDIWGQTRDEWRARRDGTNP
jgi:RimJ/RimL family protein N-acetyltransferase